MIKEIVENNDLYRKKDDLCMNLKSKKFLFNLKELVYL